MKLSESFLLTSGCLSFGAASFQLAITFSIRWSLYFGAPPSITSNPPVLCASGVIVTLFLIVFGLYALSGAGKIRRLPFLLTGLTTITVLYVLRGLFLVPGLLTLHYTNAAKLIPPQALLSSVASLAIGVAYLVGLASGWNRVSLKATSKPMKVGETVSGEN